MELNSGVLFAFVLYFAVVLVIGAYFYNKSRGMEDYILGGRQVGPYVSAMSAQASDMSGWLLMGLPGGILIAGLGEVWIGIGLIIGSYLSWLFVAKKLRKHSVVSGNALTMTEFFSNRYKDNKGTIKLICSIVILFFFTIYVASGFKSCGIVLEQIFGVGGGYVMGIGAVIIILYTFMGGYKAVCWTDFIQAMLMVVAVVAVPIVVGNAIGGWDVIVNNLENVSPESYKIENFLSLFWDGGKEITALVIISNLAWMFGYMGMPHILVRYMSISNPEQVKVARRVSLIWVTIALIAVSFIAIVGRAYYYNDMSIFDSSTQEYVFLWLVRDVIMPIAPIIAGLLFAAVMAAIMSTADSQLLVSASCVTNDLIGKGKNYSDEKLMWMSRAVVIIIAIVAFFLAMYGGSNIMGLVSFAWAGFGAAFGPLMILSLYWKKMNRNGALAAIVVGFLFTIIWNSLFNGGTLFGGALIFETGLYELFPGFFLALIVGFLVSKFTGEPSQEIQDEFDAAQTYTEN